MAWLAGAALGCEVRLDDQGRTSEGDERFEGARARCMIESPVGVSFSLVFPDGVYVVSGDAGAGVALQSDDEPCVALGTDNPEGRPVVPLLEFTEQERAQGLETEDGYRLVLAPKSGFVVGDEGYLYYEKRLQRGWLEQVRIGTGIARLRFGEPAERLEVNRYPSEPTLLWLDSRSGRAASALYADDGYVYVYDTFIQSRWDIDTFVARVLPDAVAEPSAYRYFADDEWIETPETARRILEDVPQVSVIFSPRLHGYLFVSQAWLSDTIVGRIAQFPWGPFGEVTPLYDGEPPAEFWVREVAVHSAFGSADGRQVVTSYYTDPANGAAGPRFVNVALR